MAILESVSRDLKHLLDIWHEDEISQENKCAASIVTIDDDISTCL